MASNDRSDIGPARFYTARFDLDACTFRGITLVATHSFRQADGSAFPSAATVDADGGAVPDIEAIRFDPLDGSIWYASEGGGQGRFAPFVRHASADGAWRANLPILVLLPPQPGSGPRDNLSFEGLAFAPDGQSLWLGMEAPLVQDGPVADTAHGALARFTRINRDGTMAAQYAYPLDPVQGLAAPGCLSDNAAAELLAIDDRHLLVLDRSGVQNGAGRFDFYICLYITTHDRASDVRGVRSLVGVAIQPLRKRLLLNLNAAGFAHLDNLEGMAWGPVLANGHRSLVMVSDDNFSGDQITQFLAFEVVPEGD